MEIMAPEILLSPHEQKKVASTNPMEIVIKYKLMDRKKMKQTRQTQNILKCPAIKASPVYEGSQKKIKRYVAIVDGFLSSKNTPEDATRKKKSYGG